MATTQTVAMNDNQVKDGKLFAILSYVVPFFLLVPLIQRSNQFAHFHARQSLAIVGFSILIGFVAFLLPGALAGLLSPVFLLAQLALIVFGVIHAVKGLAAPVPVLGPYAARVFDKLDLLRMNG
ncbi:MAG: hypothetical protein MI923_23920 [Phycisphaerales bacterium]|nr:hypothetical protein [Phycisphaerales bacterium]